MLSEFKRNCWYAYCSAVFSLSMITVVRLGWMWNCNDFNLKMLYGIYVPTMSILTRIYLGYYIKWRPIEIRKSRIKPATKRHTVSLRVNWLKWFSVGICGISILIKFISNECHFIVPDCFRQMFMLLNTGLISSSKFNWPWNIVEALLKFLRKFTNFTWQFPYCSILNAQAKRK